ncbi:MAG: T9SS type A sorting domain-containing protein [Saprospiraceae bacterium]|nr:T9SS type A sorting domain-containing protein [Saprospiraceae bacterium]
MKNLNFIFSLSIVLSIIPTITIAQNTVLVAPADLVVSREFQFNTTDLTNPINSTFGQIVSSFNDRKEILTFDFVCNQYCFKNQCIGYQGLVPNNPMPKPISNLACDYFNLHFDSLQPEKKYYLNWGKDGYYLNAGSNKPNISIIDNRVFTQDKKARFGTILRVFSLLGSNNETLRDTQSLWFVDCNYNPNISRALTCSDDIHVFLDSNCCVTLTSDEILRSGNGIGPYDCWSNYQVEARLWTAPNSNPIDRDSLKFGVQLKFEDLGKEFRFTVRDPVTGNSCWGHGIVEDTLPPVIIYPDTIKVSTERFVCLGRWEVPRPMIISCSDSFSYIVRTLDGDVLGNQTSGYIIINLPIGIQSADIIVTDASGNTVRKKVILKVEDLTAPIAVCRNGTLVISIVGNQSPGGASAKIFAESFEDGSYDNCQPKVWFKVIRSEELLGTNNGSYASNNLLCNGINGDDDTTILENQVYFDDFTKFCCSDVGRKNVVVLRVFDVNPGPGPILPSQMTDTNSGLRGRFTDCMVEVEVLDKSVPTVVAPPNIVISCAFPFDIKKLSDPTDNTFGRMVNNISDRHTVITRDKVCKNYCLKNKKSGYPGYNTSNQMPEPAPNKACNFYNALFDSTNVKKTFDLTWGLDGYVLSSCGNTPTITINDLRDCGQGQIQRIFSSSGNVFAIQTIWVVDCDPFHIDTLHCNDSLYSDIVWPIGVCDNKENIINGINIHPDSINLGRPRVVSEADDNCALISIDYNDEIVRKVTDSTLEIKRIWTVIDWCQYNPSMDSVSGKWINKQTIIANNSKSPMARCKSKITTSTQILNPNGTINFRISASELDNGSTDDGNGKIYFKVIRMDELLGSNHGSIDDNTTQCNGINGDDDANLSGNQIYFDDFAYFCCKDLSNTNKVILRVFDFNPGLGPVHPIRMENPNRNLYGRFSDCIVDVELKDNSIPTVVAPANVVVSCSFNIDLLAATNPNDTQFGRIVTNLSYRKKVITQDIVCHKFCEKNTQSGYPGFVQTNQIPKPAPNLACEYYNQYFDSSHSDRKYELEWGMDGSVTNSCGTLSTISIKINDMRKCGQGQIQRVITANGPGNSRYSATQTIWVVECDPFCSCPPFRVDSNHCNDTIYSDIIWPVGICENKPIEITGCPPNLSPNNPKLGQPILVKHAKKYCDSISINFKDQNTKINNTISEIIRTWTITNICEYNPAIDSSFGRWSKTQRIIAISDTIAPIANCLTGVITVPMPSSGCVTIWAKDLDKSSSDNCTISNNLTFSFNGDTTRPSITICCEDFVKAKAKDELPINVSMWVEDEAGNTDSCKTRVIVQDNIDICENVVNNIELEFEDELIISPNPCSGTLFIKTNSKIDKINLIRFTGVLYSSFEVKDLHSLTISNLQSGLYFIESIKDGKKLKSKKVIVFNE